MDEFIVEFQMLIIMIHHLLEEWLTFIFIDGLVNPLRGRVKVSSPSSLDDAIQEAYDLESIMKSLQGGSISKGSANRKLFPEGPGKAKVAAPLSKLDQLDVDTRRRFREEGKYFFYKKAWEPRHHYLGKG